MDEQQPDLAGFLMSLLLASAMVWAMLSESDRMQARLWLRLQVTRMSQRLLAVLAAREGRAGMADELAGRAAVAAERYQVAYRLAVLRDRAGHLLEGMRP